MPSSKNSDAKDSGTSSTSILPSSDTKIINDCRSLVYKKPAINDNVNV